MPHHGKVSFQTSWLQKEDEDGHKIGTWCQKESYSNAFCVICNKSFSISNSGFSQIKHFKGERHESEARCKTGKNVSHLSFTKVVETSSEAPSTSGPKQLTLQSAIADQAEILWILKVSQSDYSLSSCDGLPKLFKKMFPCPASEEFTLSRTKASYMMSDGIDPLILKLLVDDLKRSETAITLMYDETTTVQVKKQMDVLVRYWSEAEQRVTVRFLKALFFGHAKGVDVGSEIMKLVLDRDIGFPAERLFNLSSDGPNVNKTIWHFIDEKLKEKKFKGLIPMIPCNVHIIHNGFRQGLSSYGQDAENLAFDLHAWFKRSPCKREDYLDIQEECQLDDSLFVRHVPTRWCTLMGALERILKKWKAITKYFLEFLPQDAKKQRTEKLLDQNDKYKAICLKLKTYELKVCAQISFLVSVAPIFNRFLKLFQTEGPLVHILHHELKEILYALMGRFMKPDSYKERSASDLATVDVEMVENLLPVEQVEIGEPTEDFLKKLGKNQSLLPRKDMQKFLKVVTSYLQKKMSLNSELLKDLSCLHPNARGQGRSVRAIGRVARSLPHVVEEGQISLIRDEFKAYQTENIPDDWFQVQKDNGEIEFKRIDEYWNKVLTIKLPNGVKKYNLLAKVVKSAHCIHHGNSDVERSLSDNKNTVTPERTSLTGETINGLRRAKDFVSKTAGSVHNVVISKEMIQAGRTAHRAYKRRLQEEKEAEEQTKRRKLAQEEVQRQKREQAQKIEKEKETFRQKERDLKTAENKEKEEIKTAENLISEGSQRLNSAISKKDFTEVQVASALIDGAKKKIKSARKKLEEIILKRRQIDEKKSKMIDDIDMKSST